VFPNPLAEGGDSDASELIAKVNMDTIVRQSHQLKYMPQLNFLDEMKPIINIVIFLVYSGACWPMLGHSEMRLKHFCCF
jgi:hypothetical protein